MADDYMCTLTEAQTRVAKEELGEDPAERMGQVETFRQWVKEQPHIKAPTDTKTLLRFLRVSKFSQLKAREKIENYCRAVTENPAWFQDIDPCDPVFRRRVLDDQLLVLPGFDDNGCRVIFGSTGQLDLNEVSREEDIRWTWFMGYYLQQLEDTAVTGVRFIQDMSATSLGYIRRMSFNDEKKFHSAWQAGAPLRFKEFNFYKTGSIFEAFLALFKPFLSQKFKDRIKTHATLESIYDTVPMRMLPQEYLPDDYTGPNAGPINQLKENFLKEITDETFRQKCLANTHSSTFSYDKTKKIADSQGASFRKLSVDI